MTTGGNRGDQVGRAHGSMASDSDIDQTILQAVRSLDYGSVEIVVHDARVVQIERREKVRFDRSTAEPCGEPALAFTRQAHPKKRIRD